jgi:hypothetical protein
MIGSDARRSVPEAAMATKRTGRVQQAAAWLSDEPSLEELVEAYPDQWLSVERDIDRMIGRNDPEALKAYVAEVARPLQQMPGRSLPRKELLHAEIRRQMTLHALKQAVTVASTGTTGRVRFNLVNGYIAQKLLFRRDLERKPVPLAWFRTLWPLLPQRRMLLPLVQPKGIYCFYSGRLIRRLAGLIGDRPCLEIAAGDGTLTRFLRDTGVQITATDDKSWNQVQHDDDVVRKDARAALHTYRPTVVVCSWPPPGNTFERAVFATPSVQTYIVLSTRNDVAAGDWAAYRAQRDFDMTLDEELSRLLLPPESDPAVLIFERTSTA